MPPAERINNEVGRMEVFKSNVSNLRARFLKKLVVAQTRNLTAPRLNPGGQFETGRFDIRSGNTRLCLGLNIGVKSMASKWSLRAGDQIKRTELHARYGGRRQGGIAPSTQSPNVIIFTAPSGHKYGYFDGWQADGCFHYTGEGQTGDQQLKQGNRAIAEHAEKNKSLRLFAGASGTVTYVGEFKLAEDRPYYRTDAPDVTLEAIREVIVFRLRPIGDYVEGVLPTAEEHLQRSRAAVNDIDPENRAAEQFTTSAVSERVAERREATLVGEYLEFRRKTDSGRLRRLKIKPAGEVQPLYTDLYDIAENVIIEAKGTVTREAIRMSVGQLLDYQRFVQGGTKLAVLLPEKPRPDLLTFLHSLAISVIAQKEDGSFELSHPVTKEPGQQVA
jgi:hypothetical protein